MPTAKLGRSFLKALSPSLKPTIYFDEAMRGFGLKVLASGERRWIVEYRPHGGGRGVAKKRMVLGDPAVTTPEAARKTAADILARVRIGEDPMGDRQAARKAETVAELSEAFLERHVAEKRKGTTARTYEQALRTWAVAHLGSRKAISITRADVARLHASVAGGKGGAVDKNGRIPPGGRAVANASL